MFLSGKKAERCLNLNTNIQQILKKIKSIFGADLKMMGLFFSEEATSLKTPNRGNSGNMNLQKLRQNSKFVDDAGYFPEMIGKSGGQWVWRNKVTFHNKIHAQWKR